MTGGADPTGPTPPPAPDRVIDAVGRRCPVPVIELARQLPEVPVHGVVGVRADDPAARLDIPAWCALREHAYLGERTEGGTPVFLVRRLY